MITLSHTESVPMILSLLDAGREEIAVDQLMTMARMADAFGRDLEIVNLPHDELTRQRQVMLIAVGLPDPIQSWAPLTRDEAAKKVKELELAYPNATRAWGEF